MSKHKPVTLSAIQPTNLITLGNYIGAIRNWVRMQDEYDCIFFAVDLHAITTRQDPKELRAATYRAIATYIAAGIKPDDVLLFVQSHVPQHAELAWVLNCFSYMGELNRMTQYKDKSAKAGANIPVGLFGYPVLMAADILLYDAEKIPVGEDQKQHIELTRDVAIRMNNAYGKELFKVPEPTIPKVGGRVMDLQDPTSKMSKSSQLEGGTVFLFDDDKTIEKKFKRAVTDSGTEVKFDPDQKPGVSNLLEIHSCVSGKSIAELEKHFEGKQYGHLKLETAAVVIDAVRPIREEANRMLGDLGYLQGILARGAARARERAGRKLREVYDTVGFAPLA